MNWQQAIQPDGYANDTTDLSGLFPSEQATGYSTQDVFLGTFLKVPVQYERSTTFDSACSLPSRTPGLKRRSCDHEREHEATDLVRTESKKAKRHVAGTRAEKTDHGYFCTHPDCDRTFDRLCEAKKHFKAKHTPLQLKPHGCTIDGCDFRGMWPKDIRRHLKQKHGVVSPTMPTAIAVDTMNMPTMNVSYEGALANSPLEITPIEEEKQKAPNMATLAQAFSMFKRLRIRSQSSDDTPNKLIMVTKDQKNFRDVDVTGANIYIVH
ncbi:hypothetical protein CLAFUW4_07635 [Fulvia fulva]|uniref:C2H2-type domain-containing protein n=1 Tax=Passalora fulva TaxID=5499 RepID=A0A9Q8P6A0_PASFU|nr:uncharacterized protein CLAFUR5_07763 [Fulvia fulva]KAK4629219.1 hypothetical protein CLAFUR4_07640 [Fulvia fulva]KAK4630300.1 hypothetical protein CLAFUR0_07640 [Fulvia fulva]UJO14731.1 hypothetical protein CLAFUR5_07763 [Fulvia fulva]WPV12224.1 hypothetical protein CLAFUW4_07635 [Fulvia fulva]WPV28026.1 hypothetical protein CLAFUW7_07636 [Fulvia fulva]